MNSVRTAIRAVQGLTTRGRCLIAAGVAAALCSWVLNERELLRLAMFVITLPLLAVVALAWCRVRIRADRELCPPRIPANGECTVRLTLWQTGRLPTGQTVLEDSVARSLRGRPRFIVGHLPRNRSVTVDYSLRPALRGFHRIGGLRATLSDPFGLCELEHTLSGSTQLTVVPRTHEFTGLPSGAGNGTEGSGTTGRVVGAGDPDAVVRQYRQGDDMRRIHWASTARRDELMVRTEQRPRHGSTTIMLDQRSAAHTGEGSAATLEWAVSFAASVCLHLRRSGLGVRLIGEQGGPLVDVPPAAGPAQDDHILDVLTGLHASSNRDIRVGHDPSAGTELIAVLGSIGEEAASELCRYRHRSSRSVAVLLDTTACSTEPAAGNGYDAATSANLLRAAGWQVVVAGAGTDLRGVWADLCGVGPYHKPLAGAP